MNPLKRPILERYERTDDGKIIIDVTEEKIEYLFSDFDKTSPYKRKDLDEDFAYYLIESAREIGRHPFTIRLNLLAQPSEESIERANSGILNYFSYLRDLEFRKVKKMIRTSFVLLGIGLIILILSIIVHKRIVDDTGIMSTVFAEGLTVAAWVSMWEALAMFLVQWPPNREDLRIYKRMTETTISFGVSSRDSRIDRSSSLEKTIGKTDTKRQ